jgi:hypothetical protein
MKTEEKKQPYSIRCLLAIIQMNGGRQNLADKLGLGLHTIHKWVREGKVSKQKLLELTQLGEGKFSAEELIGKFDSTED